MRYHGTLRKDKVSPVCPGPVRLGATAPAGINWTAPSWPAPRHPNDQKGQPRAGGTPPTRRDSRAASHGQLLKITKRPRPRPDSFKIVNDRG